MPKRSQILLKTSWYHQENIISDITHYQSIYREILLTTYFQGLSTLVYQEEIINHLLSGSINASVPRRDY